jgi:peptide/nickel transport system permease protein
LLRSSVRRLVQALPLVLFVSLICFVLIELAPYDAVDTFATPNMPPATVDALKARYGLDQPAWIRYFHWAANALTGNLGYSIISHAEIGPELAPRLGATALLVVPAYTLALGLALFLGLWAGTRPGSLADRVVDKLSAVASALPAFWVALLMIYLFSYTLRWFPVLGMRTIGVDETWTDLAWHAVLPVLVLALANLPELVRYVRSAAADQMASEYVLVQRALGAPHGEVVRGHVFKNVLLPVITLAGMSLPLLVTGAVITESVFSWPGMGTYFIRAIQALDYPVVLAVLLLSSTAVIVGNLVADLLYAWADPRVRAFRREVRS